MNFQSILEELDKLYDAEVKKAEEAKIEEEPVKEALVEAAEEAVEEVVEDEEIEIVDDEIEVKLVLACEGCGALMIKAEADVKFDDESGLANVGEACQYCEAEEGYKAIGTFAPYAEEEVAEEATEEIAEEEIVADDIVEDEEDVEESLEEVDAEEELEEGIFGNKNKAPANAQVLFKNAPGQQPSADAYSTDMSKLTARKEELQDKYGDTKLIFKTVNVAAARKLDKHFEDHATNLDK